MSHFAGRIVASRPFHATIIAVILCAGVLVGLETNAALVARHGPLLDDQKRASRATAEKGCVLGDVTVLDQQLAGLRSQLEALRAKLSQTSPAPIP